MLYSNIYILCVPAVALHSAYGVDLNCISLLTHLSPSIFQTQVNILWLILYRLIRGIRCSFCLLSVLALFGPMLDSL